jgi:hypothetical protein
MTTLVSSGLGDPRPARPAANGGGQGLRFRQACDDQGGERVGGVVEVQDAVASRQAPPAWPSTAPTATCCISATRETV